MSWVQVLLVAGYAYWLPNKVAFFVSTIKIKREENKIVRQAIDRQSGVFTPDEADHLNVALSQINEKIRNIKTPVIGWHYDVQDILIEGAIDNNSIKVGPYFQLNFSFNTDIEITNFNIPDMVVAAVDEHGFNYQVSINNNRIKGPALGQTLRVSTYFLQ